MPVYIVTGKLGAGKTLAMVGRMQDYLAAGRMVATNINLDVRKLLTKRPAHLPLRLPDRPTIEDMRGIGVCHTTCREELNGGIFLDECGTWLNSRQWGDKGRQDFIDWLLHTRKLGWDVFLIVQHLNLVDKQIREALAEYVVYCSRLDRLRIPFLPLRLPKVHMALVMYGTGPTGIKADRWVYRGRDLYPAYQSAQLILPGQDSPGLHSLVWYETETERAKREAAEARAPKPKLRAVQLAAELPRDEAWAWARRYALASGA